MEDKKHEGFSIQSSTQVFLKGPKEWTRSGEFTTLEEAQQEMDRRIEIDARHGNDREHRIVYFKYLLIK